MELREKKLKKTNQNGFDWLGKNRAYLTGAKRKKEKEGKTGNASGRSQLGEVPPTHPPGLGVVKKILGQRWGLCQKRTKGGSFSGPKKGRAPQAGVKNCATPNEGKGAKKQFVPAPPHKQQENKYQTRTKTQRGGFWGGVGFVRMV